TIGKSAGVNPAHLETQAEEPLLLLAARGERAWVDEALHAAQNGDLAPLQAQLLFPGASDPVLQVFHFPGMAKSIRAAVLKCNNAFVEIAKLPVEQQIPRIKELEAAQQNLPVLARNLAFRIGPTAANGFFPDRARLRCAIALVA